MPAHSVDSSDFTSEERPAADFNENMNTGNVDISGVWHAQDEEGYDLETLHRPELYSLRQKSRSHYSPDIHIDNHCCRLSNGWTTDETWRAYFAVGWVETIGFIKHMSTLQSPTLEIVSNKNETSTTEKYMQVCLCVHLLSRKCSHVAWTSLLGSSRPYVSLLVATNIITIDPYNFLRSKMAWREVSLFVFLEWTNQERHYRQDI